MMETEHPVLRPLTKDEIAKHIGRFVEMSKQLKGDYWTLEHYSSDMNRKWELSKMTVEDDGTISSFTIVSQKPESLHVHRIVVAKEFQNKGLGKILMNMTIGDARKAGMPAVTLKAEADNEGTVRFYKRLGFEIVGEQGADLVLMRLKIEDTPQG